MGEHEAGEEDDLCVGEVVVVLPVQRLPHQTQGLQANHQCFSKNSNSDICIKNNTFCNSESVYKYVCSAKWELSRGSSFFISLVIAICYTFFDLWEEFPVKSEFRYVTAVAYGFIQGNIRSTEM